MANEIWDKKTLTQACQMNALMMDKIHNIVARQNVVISKMFKCLSKEDQERIIDELVAMDSEACDILEED